MTKPLTATFDEDEVFALSDIFEALLEGDFEVAGDIAAENLVEIERAAKKIARLRAETKGTAS